MRKTTLTLALLLGIGSLATVGGVALARGGDGPGFHRMMGHPDGGRAAGGFIAAELGLTAEQKEAARKIHMEAFEKAGPLMEQHRTEMEAIETLLDEGSATAEEIGTRVIAAHATKTQMHAVHDAAMEEFKALLTAEQKAKLETLQENRPERSKMRMMMHH